MPYYRAVKTLLRAFPDLQLLLQSLIVSLLCTRYISTVVIFERLSNLFNHHSLKRRCCSTENRCLSRLTLTSELTGGVWDGHSFPAASWPFSTYLQHTSLELPILRVIQY
ncbi:hypothetical protein NEUTE2DRAFT_48514 [Neurospora tetrasperma FGSC 2509]|nr:hypothetical protein NEUTE2DRAFT_48514 [Neurospora tetrasperma FGSC 2509]